MLIRPRPAPNERTPTVSVVVPCYNYGAYLPECIDSIVTQDDVMTDVLVIDDASTDGSHDVAQSLADKHAAVQVIRHRKNMGHIATYNEGLALAKGDYVVLISADDLLAPGALGRATALMEARPDVGLVYGSPRVFSGATPTDLPSAVRSWSVWSGRRWTARQCRRSASLIYSPEAVVRTSVQQAVGEYRADLPHSGDLEMWLRVAAVAGVGRVNGPVQALKRSHGLNMITTSYSTALADLTERQKAYVCFFNGPGRALPQSEQLRRSSWRRMSAEAMEWACGQLAAGTVEPAELHGLIDFAQELDPEFASHLAWTELSARMEVTEPSPTGRARVALLARQRDIRQRLRWHRWNLLGT